MRIRRFGLFGLDRRYEELARTGDPRVRLVVVVDFALFRPELARALVFSNGPKGGRPPWDAVLMFEVFVLQAPYGLSDEALEFQMRDRSSSRRFLDPTPDDPVPDARTLWKWRKRLVRAGAFERLFERFDWHLREQGHIA